MPWHPQWRKLTHLPDLVSWFHGRWRWHVHTKGSILSCHSSHSCFGRSLLKVCKMNLNKNKCPVFSGSRLRADLCSGENCLTELAGCEFEATSPHLQGTACLSLSLPQIPLMCQTQALGLSFFVIVSCSRLQVLSST
jgi:hypothetical protein